MKKRNDITISKCVCPECGKNFPIPRRMGKLREHGHIKDIWCPFCKEVRKFKEGVDGKI